MPAGMLNVFHRSATEFCVKAAEPAFVKQYDLPIRHSDESSGKTFKANILLSVLAGQSLIANRLQYITFLLPIRIFEWMSK